MEITKREKEAEEEERYSILNELDIEKTILENTLYQPQEDLDKYPEDLLEQYKEELEMFKRTIAYIEKLKSNSIPKDLVIKKIQEQNNKIITYIECF